MYRSVGKHAVSVLTGAILCIAGCAAADEPQSRVSSKVIFPSATTGPARTDAGPTIAVRSKTQFVAGSLSSSAGV
jgi:hypothetical protein